MDVRTFDDRGVKRTFFARGDAEARRGRFPGVFTSDAPRRRACAPNDLENSLVSSASAQDRPAPRLHVKGIDYLGPLPADIQETTVFAAALHKDARSPDAARALINFLSAPAAAPVIRNAGMDPR